MINIPRPEYPRPQMVRKNWMNLNGKWDFEIDYGKSGVHRELFKKSELESEIIVPFCPESDLSGIGNKDYMESVWYKRSIEVPEKWSTDGRVILHIGACDYHTIVWVNGEMVGENIGGYVSFSFDITEYLNQGENVLTINAVDEFRNRNQPSGKQCLEYYSHGCYYTRTTGIWQTVWLEHVPEQYIVKTKYKPDINSSSLSVEAFCEQAHGKILEAEAFYKGNSVGKSSAVVVGKEVHLTLQLSELHLWEIGSPELYDLKLSLNDDVVESYFGMRQVAINKEVFYLNNKVVFQRLILDQGFYPDGIYTAPTEEQLVNDIHLSMDMGFNGARLHEKVFEPRFLYHCDRLGYIVWGEHASWGLDKAKPEAWKGIAPSWIQVIERDFNHPAIIGWCPLNETQKDQDPWLLRFLTDMTRAYDSTRPVIDTSGWRHVNGATDIIDTHDYEQNPAIFKEHFQPVIDGEDVICTFTGDYSCPTFISEYGGIWWSDTDKSGWGYGERPKSKEEVIERYRGLTLAILENPKMMGFCYTQLTDVEQEQNGLYTYDRKSKFDSAIIKEINQTLAAVEINHNK